MEDVAADLGVTRNVVRSRLALLEREGIVEIRGEVRDAKAGGPLRAPMEALLKDLTGLPVTEHCEHGLSPKCRFEIGLAGKGEKSGGRG